MLMYKVNVQNLELLLRYNEFYGDEITKPDLQTEVSQINVNKAISIISELIAIRSEKIRLPKKYFSLSVEIPFEMILKVHLLNLGQSDMLNPLLKKNVHIISLQMLLNLLKYILAYGNQNTICDNKYTITFEDYKQIIDLQMLITESFDKQIQEFNEGNISHFIYANYHINDKKSNANAIARAYYMFEVVLKHPEVLDNDVQKEYKDYNSQFEKKYGYTIFDYLCFLFTELEMYCSGPELKFSSLWRNIGQKYRTTRVLDINKRIIEDLSISPVELHEWAIKNYENMWDFSDFFSKPFFKACDEYISISDLTIDNALFQNLFWMIRDCYPREESRCMAFYGRLFEKYVQMLTESAITKNSNYSYIPEFTCKSGNKSSDAYFCLGTDLVIIECKGFSTYINTLISGSNTDENNNRIFIKPILQADARFDEIVNNDNKFSSIKRTFIISVTMDNINAVPQYYNEIYREVEINRKSLLTKYIYNFNIEEYELLMYLLETQDNVIQLLETYYDCQVIEPFKSYVLREYPSEHMQSSYVDSLYKEVTEKVKERLFG